MKIRNYFTIFLTFLLLFFLISAPVFAASSSDDEQSEKEKRLDTLKFGLESEITSLINTLMKENDSSMSAELFEVFQKTKNITIRETLIDYFVKFQDVALKDYALEILEDPYDFKKSTVNKLISYVGNCGFTEAAELLVPLLDQESEDYADACIAALGKIGGPDEAVFLAEYMDRDLTVGRRQTLMKALGQIKAVETWDKLVECIEDEDENTYVRMYAAEAIGAMELEDSIDVLMELFESGDSNLRTYAMKGLSYFSRQDVLDLFIEAFRDNYYKVRLEAAEAVKKHKVEAAVPSLIYRAKNDGETAVKTACMEALGGIGTREAWDYLISVLKDNKKNDTLRSKAATVILAGNDDSAADALLEVAEAVVADTKKTTLRYNIGKELAKYSSAKFEKICRLFLESSDASTKGIGLDIWKKNPFESLNSVVIAISKETKQNAITRKAKQFLEEQGIEIPEEELKIE